MTARLKLASTVLQGLRLGVYAELHALLHAWHHQIHVVLGRAHQLNDLLLTLNAHGLEDDAQGHILCKGVVPELNATI